MPDRTVLIDAGWFVGRWRRHLRTKRGLLARMLAGASRGNVSRQKVIGLGRRYIGQDLKYLRFRLRQHGLNAADVILCYDGTHARQRRGELLGTYKANRILIHPEATELEAEELIASYTAADKTIPDMRDHFKSYGFEPNLGKDWTFRYLETHEADDLIAEYVVAAPSSEEITIISADSDLWQLLNYPNVSILDPTEGDHLRSMITPDDVMDRYGVTCELYADWKSLAGDASDNLPGIPNVGKRGATALVIEHGSLEEMPDEIFEYGRISDNWASNIPKHLVAWIKKQTKRGGGKVSDDLLKARHGALILELRDGKNPIRPTKFYERLVEAEAIPGDSWEKVNLRATANLYRRLIRLPFK